MGLPVWLTKFRRAEASNPGRKTASPTPKLRDPTVLGLDETTLGGFVSISLRIGSREDVVASKRRLAVMKCEGWLAVHHHPLPLGLNLDSKQWQGTMKHSQLALACHHRQATLARDDVLATTNTKGY